MATTNVVVSRTGTAWTVDVTACNLYADTSVKDFLVLINSSIANNADFAKTTSTTLTYSGAAVPAASTVEVRRKTPTSVIQVIDYGTRFGSADYNNEMDRIVRRAEEYELNGVGAGSVVTVATPLDTAFGVSWDGNIINPPTMNAAYDYLVQLAKIASPVFTGDPQAPTPATADNDTSIATTAYVKSNLTSYATLASPTFTGTPVAPTPAGTDNSTKLATTAFVQSEMDLEATRRLIVAGFYPNTSSALGIALTAATDNFLGAFPYTLQKNVGSAFATGTSLFTPPTTGLYRVSMSCVISAGAGMALTTTLFENSSQFHQFHTVTPAGSPTAMAVSTYCIMQLDSTKTYKFGFNPSVAATMNRLSISFEFIST